MAIGINDFSGTSTRFNKNEFKQLTRDYLRHAKESHSFLEQDLLNIYTEGAKSPSNALIYLHSGELDYLKELRETLPRDEYKQKQATIKYNVFMANSNCNESKEFDAFTDAIEKMYKNTWILRTQLILSGRFYGGIHRKLPNFLKGFYKKFMPKNIEKAMTDMAKKNIKV